MVPPQSSEKGFNCCKSCCSRVVSQESGFITKQEPAFHLSFTIVCPYLQLKVSVTWQHQLLLFFIGSKDQFL